MSTKDDIKKSQLDWAVSKGIKLSEIYPYYCRNADCNIYDGLYEKVREQFYYGSGNELKDKKSKKTGKIEPAKMRALHSSSALCVNLFQYFIDENGQAKNFAKELLIACGLINENNDGDVKSIEFEKKFSTGISTPNLDVVIKYGTEFENHLFAFESKFNEPYSSHYEDFNLLKKSYYSDKNKRIWDNVGSLYDALIEIKEKRVPGKKKNMLIFDYNYLDGAQLIKHILGIANTLTKNNDESNVKLIYLWYDTFDSDGEKHRNEINEFCDFIKQKTDNAKKNVDVIHRTYQEVIDNLSSRLSDLHQDYLNYLKERYL